MPKREQNFIHNLSLKNSVCTLSEASVQFDSKTGNPDQVCPLYLKREHNTAEIESKTIERNSERWRGVFFFSS
ncbi:Mitogen-activated protein kinase-binding protein 1 [Clarias magur]|uniref:Mitogen-activated protein kinase-binding protein 1 n=1 Tax=Clarias magur TaxID=1594786 RepID=A0A8J4U1X5_CLAMG|nr:Mitogen-activated protein kinase-binding protein 1 [Clarias magur]